jgi:hypothetical protein
VLESESRVLCLVPTCSELHPQLEINFNSCCNAATHCVKKINIISKCRTTEEETEQSIVATWLSRSGDDLVYGSGQAQQPRSPRSASGCAPLTDELVQHGKDTASKCTRETRRENIYNTMADSSYLEYLRICRRKSEIPGYLGILGKF